MQTGTVRLTREDRIAVITLDRPQRRNAMDESMWSAFTDVITAIERDLPRAIILTGAGDQAFCAGQDIQPDNPQISGLITAVQTHDPAPVDAMLRRIRDVVDRFVSLPIPIIAAVNGVAFGGGAELAVRCDLRVADPSAMISFSEVRLGL